MMSETDFLEYVEAMCKRPRLYTPTGSFYEVVSFLEGLGAGFRVGEKAYHSVFTPFREWMRNKFQIKDTIFNWEHFRELFGSDSEALKQLPILYKKYAELVSLEN